MVEAPSANGKARVRSLRPSTWPTCAGPAWMTSRSKRAAFTRRFRLTPNGCWAGKTRPRNTGRFWQSPFSRPTGLRSIMYDSSQPSPESRAARPSSMSRRWGSRTGRISHRRRGPCSPTRPSPCCSPKVKKNLVRLARRGSLASALSAFGDGSGRRTRTPPTPRGSCCRTWRASPGKAERSTSLTIPTSPTSLKSPLRSGIAPKP